VCVGQVPVEQQTDSQTAAKGQSARQNHRVLRDSSIETREWKTVLMIILFTVLIFNGTRSLSHALSECVRG
jgi:hypothetical protein